MAEVLGAVAAASQLGSQVIFLFKAIRSVKYSSVALRAFRCKLEELRLISICIQQNPLLHTEEIGSHTNNILGLLRANPVASTLAKRGLRRALAFIFDQKAFDALFKELEERKSTLSLCITNVHAHALYDIRTHLYSHTMGAPSAPSTATAEWHGDLPPRPGGDTSMGPWTGPKPEAAATAPAPPVQGRATPDAQGADDEPTKTPAEGTAEFVNNVHAGDGRYIVGAHKTRNRPGGTPLVEAMRNFEIRDSVKMDKRHSLLDRAFIPDVLQNKANAARSPQDAAPAGVPLVAPVSGDASPGGPGLPSDGNRGTRTGAMVVGALFEGEADLEPIAGKFACNVNTTDGDMVTGFKC